MIQILTDHCIEERSQLSLSSLYPKDAQHVDESFVPYSENATDNISLSCPMRPVPARAIPMNKNPLAHDHEKYTSEPLGWVPPQNKTHSYICLRITSTFFSYVACPCISRDPQIQGYFQLDIFNFGPKIAYAIFTGNLVSYNLKQNKYPAQIIEG